MTTMSVGLGVLLTAGVVGLAVVPYLRAVTASGAGERLDDVRRQIEREREHRYCLDCSVPFDRASLRKLRGRAGPAARR